MLQTFGEVVLTSGIPHSTKELAVNGYLTEVLIAASHVIQISDAHPVGGIIVFAIVYAVCRRGTSKPK
ncbi:MAG: hypothetical protein ACXW2U_09665 [Telluria sp.]